MKIVDLLDVLNSDRSVGIFYVGSGTPVVDYDSINSVELKFAINDVIGIDMNTGTGGEENYYLYGDKITNVDFIKNITCKNDINFSI